MKTEPSPAATPDATPQTGEAVVAAYLAQELPKARQILKRTRITGIVLILFVGAYMGVISTIMVRFFQPKAAAEVASGMLAQRVVTDGPILAARVEWAIPHFIHEVPDYLIGELPVYRKELQQSLETEYETYCNSLNKDLGDQLDKMIDENKATIKTLLENASDRDTIRKTLPDFDKVINEALKNNAEGQALREHIDEIAAALKEVEKHMDRLANGSNLTVEEQKARQALALLSKVIRDTAKMPEDVSADATAPATKPVSAPATKPKQ
jgi:Na+-transporting methylmalonyl-CoA/oxaloacetate decarboxylase gamma subunit